MVFVMHPLPPHTDQNLAPRERITTDERDEGLRCEPEGHLENVIRELHADCSWRWAHIL
jgi:hypothetical protein